MEDLKIFSKNQGAMEANDLTHWDTGFWAERLRESKYDINEVSSLPTPHVAGLVCQTMIYVHSMSIFSQIHLALKSRRVPPMIVYSILLIYLSMLVFGWVGLMHFVL